MHCIMYYIIMSCFHHLVHLNFQLKCVLQWSLIAAGGVAKSFLRGESAPSLSLVVCAQDRLLQDVVSKLETCFLCNQSPSKAGISVLEQAVLVLLVTRSRHRSLAGNLTGGGPTWGGSTRRTESARRRNATAAGAALVDGLHHSRQGVHRCGKGRTLE